MGFFNGLNFWEVFNGTIRGNVRAFRSEGNGHNEYVKNGSDRGVVEVMKHGFFSLSVGFGLIGKACSGCLDWYITNIALFPN